jgi:phospholipid transport system substrate-binding protein
LSIENIRVILFVSVLFVASGGLAEDGDTVDSAGATPAAAVSAENGSAGAPAVADGGADSAPKEAPNDDTSDDSPVAVVKRLNASLQKVLEDAEQLGYNGRVERLSPILDAAFDFDYMAQKTVGRHWSTLSPDEQKRWVQVFAELTKATYAGRFDRFSGQTFEFVDEQKGANDSVVVRSKVVSPGEDDVDLSYRLGKTPAGWKVIDVYFKGTVSELAMRRADYSSVLKRDGFEALIARVNQRIAELSASGSP